MNNQQKQNSYEYPYHVLDETTPWYEFLMYCEICHQLDVPGQPKLGRYMAYRRYLKEVGVIK
jgi:hypothetical protein